MTIREPQIARISNPNHLLIPSIQEFFAESFAAAETLPGPFFDYVQEFMRMASIERIAILMGAEEDTLAALAIIILPADRLVPHPQVYHFYNRGSDTMKEAMIQAVVQFVDQAGYETFRAINLTGNTDAAWKKTFKSAGDIKKVGSIMEFNIAP